LTRETATSDLDINLASILNILWRRRLIVIGLPALGLLVGVLYGIFGTRRWEATATIRPGITAFSPDGGAWRQWQLKDITRWYEKQLYRQELVERLGLPAGSRPVIRAEFIAQGLQNLQGGDVITLWTTATSPELAAAILDSSMAVFADYAEADTISSQLKLTRDGLQLQIQGLETQLLAVDKQEAAIGLRLESARAESMLVVAENQELALEVDKLDGRIAYFEHRLVDLAEEEPRLLADLTQLDHALRRVSSGEAEEMDDEELPSWVRRDAVLDGGDVLEALATAKLSVQEALADNRAWYDSLSWAAELSRLKKAQLEIQREVSIRAKIREVEGVIGDLVLERDYDLPSQRRDFETQITERLVKLGTIAPLQRVGDTVTSDDPVRPRPLRAILILVFLGIAGGLVLAFVWDYVAAHRQEIFRS
jgi:hypothetical protein